MNIKLKKYFWVIYLVEAIILITAGAMAYTAYHNHTKIETSLSDWKSNLIAFDNGWYVDEETVQLSNEAGIIYGPYIALEKGSYSINIQYECSSEQSFKAYAANGNDAYIKGGIARLDHSQTAVTYKVILTEDIDNFEVVVNYNGKGSLRIRDITITTNAVLATRRFFVLLLCCILFHSCLLFYRKIKQHRNFLLAFGGVVFLSCIPLFMKGIVRGHDLTFHLMRIEGIAQELRMGNFPVKLSSIFMGGYGYPASIYYGDLLLYIPAFLRIAGFSVVESYKVFIFFINTCTAIVSYCCFEKIFKNRRTAFLTCFAYMTASYRLVNIYVRAAVGEYSAMLFLPILALAIYRIYTQDTVDWKKYKKNAVLLAVGMSGLIGTHVLTVEMAVSIMIFLCMVLWKKTIKRNTICLYICAVIQTLLLNLYFIVPFLDYYKNVKVNINSIVSDSVMKIQSSGADVGYYFSFFRNIFGDGIMTISPGPVLMIAFILAIILCINGKVAKKMYLLVICSVLTLYMASNLFPWDHLAANFKLGNFLAQIQFPWRYMEFAVIFLTVLLGVVLNQALDGVECLSLSYRQLGTGVFTISVLMAVIFASNYSERINSGNVMVVTESFETAELSSYSAGACEYLRAGTDKNALNGAYSYANMQTVALVSRNGTHMELYCEGTDQDGMIEIPVFHYKGYHVRDQNGTEYEIKDGTNNVINFSLPAGFSGNVTIDFEEPWYWRVAELLSLATAILLSLNWILQIVGSKQKTIGEKK